MTEKEIYDAARIAVRESKEPEAFYRLGTLYAKGIGTKANQVLANYFFEKAMFMGCEEAEQCIEQAYESGTKDISKDIMRVFEDSDSAYPHLLASYRNLVERQRGKKNYGILSKIRKHLHYFYPDYSQEKAITDILNDRDTIDAELFYATSTMDNQFEVNVDIQESFLQQLFAPIIQDKALYQKIVESEESELLENEQKDLLQCVVNLSDSYKKICDKHGIAPKEIKSLEAIDLFPYTKPTTLALLRKQGLKCLLSVKDVNTIIRDKFLKYLDSDERLLNVCEKIADENTQLFLISFVELNVDIKMLENNNHDLLESYRHQKMSEHPKCLNSFATRLSHCGFEHQLPRFTTENLPPINLEKERAL